MAFAVPNFCPLLRPLSRAFLQISSSRCSSSLNESIRSAIESKAYQQIPDLFNSSKESPLNQNPFSFLSTFSETHRVSVIDEILQSFIPIRPRYRPRMAYSCLLLYTLGIPSLLPLALVVVQRTLRSGCIPIPQSHSLLSISWLNRRLRPQSVSSILSEMRLFGYSPDSGTCNYIILSLCKSNQFEEAVSVLRGMVKSGCIPNLDTYGTLLDQMGEHRKTRGCVEIVREMVCLHGLNPRKQTIVKAVDALRGNGDMWGCVGMIELLENEDVEVGFEAYESAVVGCLEARQFVLAGKFALRMTGKGFIPVIRVRQRVVEGLVSIGEVEFASVMRRRFAELKS